MIGATTTARGSLILRYFGFTVLIALVSNLAIWGIGSAAGADFGVQPPGTDTVMEINAVAVALTTIVSMSLGWALAAYSQRRGRPTLRTVAIIAAAFAVISVAQPLAAEGDTAARLVLASMHLVTGAIFVAAVQRFRRSQEAGLP